MALAVLIDATLVRGVLVPAFMRVMGSAMVGSALGPARGRPDRALRGRTGARRRLIRPARSARLIAWHRARSSRDSQTDGGSGTTAGAPRSTSDRPPIPTGRRWRLGRSRSDRVDPAVYVAAHGADMTGFTYDEARYADPELDAWLLEVGRLLRLRR